MSMFVRRLFCWCCGHSFDQAIRRSSLVAYISSTCTRCDEPYMGVYGRDI